MDSAVARRSGCSWWAWGLACLILIGVVAILWPVVQAARRAALRMQRSNNMKQVGLALHNFHDVYKRWPPAVRTDEAGRPLSSWRCQLPVFMEAMMLHVDAGERWDDPGNRFLWTFLFCWNSRGDLPENGHTSVMGITGPGTAFDAGKVVRRSDLDEDTIVAIEVADSDVFWMEPGDLSPDEIDQAILRGPDGTGTHVLFATGDVWFLKAETPLAELKKFLTVEESKKYDRDELLGPYREK